MFIIKENDELILSTPDSFIYLSNCDKNRLIPLFCVEEMYKLNLSAQDTIEYSGMLVDPSSRRIELNPSWNWIGYLPNFDLDINDALVSLGEDAVYIKGQVGYSDYYDGFGWLGALNTLSPHEGYLLNMDAASTLLYPSSVSDGLARVYDNFNYSILDYEFDYTQFEFNGSVTSEIDIENIVVAENDLLIAQVDGEIRGKAHPMLFPLTGKYIFPLMVYSNEVLENSVDYQYYNSTQDKYYALSSELNFEKDMIIGNGLAPYRFTDAINEIS